MLTRYVQRNLTWIDLVSPSPAEVRSLMREFNLDPLVAEELLAPTYRPKVERRGDIIYAILHFPVLRGIHKRPAEEIDFIIGKHFLITTRYGVVDPLHAFAKAFEVNAVLGGTSAMSHGGHVFAAMARMLYQVLEGECESVERHLDDIEERIFTGDERRMVADISQTGRTIYDFRQFLLPHREMLASLEGLSARLLGPEFSFYIRGIIGEYERVRSAVEHLREALVELRETNNSLLSTKQNEIMKTLTIMAFVTFPLTLISSIFGMNTHYLPIVGLPGDFWIVTGMMAMLAGTFFFYFKHKGWL